MSVQRLRQHSSALLLIAGLGAGVAAAQTATPFDSTRAYNHVRDQVAFGPRPAGSPANDRCAAHRDGGYLELWDCTPARFL